MIVVDDGRTSSERYNLISARMKLSVDRDSIFKYTRDKSRKGK